MRRSAPCLLFLLWLLVPPARAGLSAETTLLVVNADSPLSLTVANLWMELRPIPQSHVLHLHGIPGLETLSMEKFRTRILDPVRDFLEETGLSEKIDTIVYSADFPFAVSLAPVLRTLGIRPHKYIGDAGSITSLTFFHNLLEEAGPDDPVGLVNHYYRRELDHGPDRSEHLRQTASHAGRQTRRFEPPRGFSSRLHWARHLLPHQAGNRDRYHLAAMLAYTGERGNSLPEIASYLARSARADGSHPSGTVYLMKNWDVRAKTRQPWFDLTCRLLRAIGHRCRILANTQRGEDGILPQKRKDVIGLVAGTRWFDWKKSGSRMLPGAFADSLTSYGADFDNPSQTKLTAFLRHGASGSSGAVVEPYAIAEKFPLPLLHYYYALGYTLAEAWYMSVASPYQTLLVGDPLTRPFADPVKVSIRTPDPGSPWQGTVSLETDLSGKSASAVDRLELWIDGRPVAEASPGQPLTWDTTTVADGHHELHLVAVEKPPREGRTTRRYWIRVDNGGATATFTARPDRTPYATPFLLEGTAPPGSRISIRQGRRELLSLTSDRTHWEAILPTSPLGMGKVTLQAIVTTADGRTIFSNPLHLTITRARNLHAVPEAGRYRKGLEAVIIVDDGEGEPRRERRNVPALDGREDRIPGQETRPELVTLLGQFRVERDGFHQLSIHTRGEIRVRVDGREFRLEAPRRAYGMVYLPLFLEKGWHRLELQPDPEGTERLRVTLSGESTPRVLDERITRTPER